MSGWVVEVAADGPYGTSCRVSKTHSENGALKQRICMNSMAVLEKTGHYSHPSPLELAFDKDSRRKGPSTLGRLGRLARLATSALLSLLAELPLVCP